MIRGAVEMIKKLTGFQEKFPERVAEALYQEAQIEMTEAKRRTPVDVNYTGGRKPPHPGQLRASGIVHQPIREGKSISVTLSFGGGAIDYAIWVHEIEENFHPVGQWKYLESVLNESRSHMAARIAKRIDLGR